MPGIAFQRLGQIGQTKTAGLHAHLGPGRLRRACRSNRFGGFTGTAERHAMNRLAGGRIDHIVKGITDRKEGVPVNPQRNGLAAFWGKIHIQALFLAA